jgi:hypothetical protein
MILKGELRAFFLKKIHEKKTIMSNKRIQPKSQLYDTVSKNTIFQGSP